LAKGSDVSKLSDHYKKPIKEIIQQPITTWRENLSNDFEKVVFEKHPTIKNIKEELYKQGAIYAAMSGSGSTVFGIFNKETDLLLKIDSQYFIKEI